MRHSAQHVGDPDRGLSYSVDTAANGRHDRSVELSAAFVAVHWELTGVSVTPSRIGRFGRGVFTVASREGTYAAKVNDAPPDLYVATKELEVFTYLADRRYVHVPELFRTRQPVPLVHTGDRSVVLMEYVPGHFDPDVGRRRRAVVGPYACRVA